MKRAAFLLGIAVILVVSVTHRNPVRAQQIDDPLPVYTAAGTSIPNAHAVVGHLKASPGGDTVTLTGPAVFTGAETYSCAVSVNAEVQLLETSPPSTEATSASPGVEPRVAGKRISSASAIDHTTHLATGWLPWGINSDSVVSLASFLLAA